MIKTRQARGSERFRELSCRKKYFWERIRRLLPLEELYRNGIVNGNAAAATLQTTE